MELSVVTVILGILSAFAVPRLLVVVERSKASEAFRFLTSVRTTQELYLARHGTYADDLAALDMQLPVPTYFNIHHHSFHTGDTGSFADSWNLKLERTGFSAGYGEYHVTFTQDGYEPDESTIESYPEIIPMSQ